MFGKSRNKKPAGKAFKVFKYTLYSVIGTSLSILTLLVLALFLANFINLNSYRTDIEQIAAKNGVHLTIKGNVTHRILYPIYLEIDEVYVYESPDKTSHNLIQLKKIAVEFSPLTLLYNVLKINNVTVVGLTVSNKTYADGSNSLSRFLKGINPKAPVTPPKAEKEVPADPFDISLYNVKVERINIKDIAYYDETASRKLELSGFSLTGQNIDLDKVNQLNLRFHTGLKNKNAAEIVYDANAQIEFKLDRKNQILNVSEFNLESYLTLDPFIKQPIDLKAGFTFDIKAMKLDLPSLKLDVKQIVTANLTANASLKDKIAANFDLQLSSPRIQTLTSKYIKKNTSNKSDIPFNFSLEGNYDLDLLKIKQITAELGKTKLEVNQLAYALKDSSYEAYLSLNSPENKHLTDSMGLKIFQKNLPVSLNLIAKGNIEKMLHRLNGKLSAGNLDMDINLSSGLDQSQDIGIKARLKAVSPDVSKLIDAFQATNFPSAVPFSSSLETDTVIGQNQISVNNFHLDLNQIIRFTADGTVNNYKTNPGYNFTVKNTSKDLKRIIALFTGNSVQFHSGSLENLKLSLNISGDNQAVSVKRFNISNRDILLSGETRVLFAPLTINANFLGKRLNVDPFIPLPKKNKPVQSTVEKIEDPAPEKNLANNTPNNKPAFFKILTNGDVILSKEQIEKFDLLPDMDVSANLTLNNILFGKNPKFNIRSNVTVKRKQQAEATVRIEHAMYTDASVYFNITKNKNKSLRLLSDIEFKSDFRNTSKNPAFPLKRGQVHFKSKLSSTGNSVDALFKNISFNADLNADKVQLSEDPLPNLNINGQIGMTLKNSLFDLNVNQLNAKNNSADSDKENFHANIGKISVKTDLSDILRQSLTVNSVSVDGTDISLFQNQQGLLGLSQTEKSTPAVSAKATPKKQSSPQSGYSLKHIVINNVSVKNTAFVFNDLVQKISQNLGLAELSLQGNGIIIDDGLIRTDKTNLSIQALKFDNKIQSVTLPALSIELSRLMFDPNTQFVKIGKFGFSLPEVNAVLDTQIYTNKGLALNVNDMNVFYSTDRQKKANNLDVRFDSVSIDNRDLLVDLTKIKHRINVQNFSLLTQAPKGTENMNVKLSVAAQHMDTSADTKNMFELQTDGTLSLNIGKKRYATDLIINTKADLDFAQDAPKTAKTTVNVIYDQTNSILTINELSVKNSKLISLMVAANANISPKDFYANGRLQVSIFNLNDILSLLDLQNRTDKPKVPIEVDIAASTEINSAQKKIVLKSNEISVSKLPISLNGYSTLDFDTNKFAGEFNIFAGKLKQIIEVLTETPIDSKKSDILKDFKVFGRVSSEDEILTLNQFNISFDETTIKASGSRNLNTGKTELSVVADRMNADDYLPPKKETVEKEEEVKEQNKEPVQFSKKILFDDKTKETLKALDIYSAIVINDFTVKDIHFDKISLTATANKGILQINPFKIEQEGGVIETHATLDLQKETPAYALDLSINQLEIANMTRPFLKDTLSGTVNATIDANSDAQSVYQLLNDLDGNIYIAVNNAIFRGFNVEYYICVGLSAISLDYINQEDFPADTFIENVTVEGLIDKGRLKIYDIYSDLNTINATGAGEFHLIKQNFDLNTYMSIVETKENDCKIRGELKKYVLKTHCEGPVYNLEKLSCVPDYKALGELVYEGVAGRVNDMLAHYQKQIDSVSKYITEPLSKLRLVVVDFFNFIGSIFSGEDSNAPNKNKNVVLYFPQIEFTTVHNLSA